MKVQGAAQSGNWSDLTETMAEILRVENLRVEFETNAGQVKALNGVSFSQEEGQIYCVVGESGAGKSTLALAIMGLLPNSATLVEGSVSFNGVNLTSANMDYMRSIRGKEITMVFQDAQTALNPVQTVGTQLEEVILNHTNLSTRQANRMAQDVLRDLGLPDPRRILGEYPFNLSGGMCQRVMIGIALVLQPKLLIADEATSGLDVTLQAEILDRLKRLCRDLNSAVLLITHDMGIVAHMANRVGVLYAGSLAETADVIPLFKEPRHPYTWSLIQSLPRLDDAGRRLQPLRGSPPDMINLPEECAFLPRCHKALSQCRVNPSPPLKEVGGNHAVACFNPMVE